MTNASKLSVPSGTKFCDLTGGSSLPPSARTAESDPEDGARVAGWDIAAVFERISIVDTNCCKLSDTSDGGAGAVDAGNAVGNLIEGVNDGARRGCDSNLRCSSCCCCFCCMCCPECVC